MRRALPFLLLLAAAAPAARAGEGVYFTVDVGYAKFDKDTLRSNLTQQIGQANAAQLTDKQMPDGLLTALRLGVNISGHVALEASLGVRPWNLLDSTRGALGMAGLGVRWFPLQGLVRPSRQVDFSLLAGMNYFLLGGNGNEEDKRLGTLNPGRGLDGMALELGGTLEVYPAKWVSLGITPRYAMLHPIRYFIDYNNRDKGGQLPLTGSVGGSMLSVALSITFHFEPQPE